MPRFRALSTLQYWILAALSPLLITAACVVPPSHDFIARTAADRFSYDDFQAEAYDALIVYIGLGFALVAAVSAAIVLAVTAVIRSFRWLASRLRPAPTARAAPPPYPHPPYRVYSRE